MQSYAQPAACGSPTTLSDHERFQIDDALSTLSEREKQAYILRFGLCFSLRQVALEMGITKSAVQTMLERSEKKIADNKANSLFLVG
ncbi:sigma factor-like helix-turn-helix DNA-binding protein [Paenibacillus lautus]|uniref:sigma factor-like helix-turn-helix DNA-binding protein n=1 Tax=Paenibacillus lautus TaxID=1401 RepID=UPI003D2C35A5